MEHLSKKKNAVTAVLLILLVPAVVVFGAIVFKEKYYAWVCVCVTVLSCIPLFYAFERKESSSKELAVLAILIALSVAGRFIFVWLPGFKPVTAITVIAAIYLGREAGFVVGSLSALVSNFYFGQGPWTPFQMFAWGILGFFAGVLSNRLLKSRMILCLFGFVAGIAYSLTMDVWTTLWADGTFNIIRYLSFVVTAIPVTIEYAVSNVVFLLFLTNPIGEKLSRIKKKYGLFITYNTGLLL